MNPLDSIDGLGLTWDDLTPNGKLKALFTQMKKLEISQVRDAFMPKEVLYKHDDVSEHTWNVVSHIIAFVCGMIAAALMCLGVR